MKKILVIMIVLISLMSTAEAKIYPRFGSIVDIEYDTDFVTVDDGLGNLWEFCNSHIAWYYYYGDMIVMLMDDSDTPEWVYDDKVLSEYYCDEEDCAEIIREWREKQSFRRFF